MEAWEPVYLGTHRRGLLQGKIDAAYDILSRCTLCPRSCLVDRHHGELGMCRTGDKPVVSSYAPHFGEEDPLVGRHGSGTIFFTHCNLYCLFCQNYEISHGGEGEEVSVEDLAAAMFYLQKRGCHNINFVTPSHQVYQILAALPLAIEGGLNVPLVYNTGGYDALETLQLLDGVVDIYMPDFKFWDPKVAGDLCQAEDYPEIACQAVTEMHRQVGDLVVDEQGVARRGLLVRHLVLPDGLAGTRRTTGFPGQPAHNISCSRTDGRSVLARA
jgi:putative pyruvate formate lyase activating enzyme